MAVHPVSFADAIMLAAAWAPRGLVHREIHLNCKHVADTPTAKKNFASISGQWYFEEYA